jgi:hypothetical protein
LPIGGWQTTCVRFLQMTKDSTLGGKLHAASFTRGFGCHGNYFPIIATSNVYVFARFSRFVVSRVKYLAKNNHVTPLSSVKE